MCCFYINMCCVSTCNHRELHIFPTLRSSYLDAKSVPEAVDIIAAATAAKTIPRSPFGMVSNAISVNTFRSEEKTSELQSRCQLVCRLLLEKNNINYVLCRLIYLRQHIADICR